MSNTVQSATTSSVRTKKLLKSLRYIFSVVLFASFFASSLWTLVWAATPENIAISPTQSQPAGGSAATITGDNLHSALEGTDILSAGDDNEGESLAIDADGNRYLSGPFSGSMTIQGTTVNAIGGYDMYVAKFDAAGDLLWLRTGGGTSNDNGNGVAVDDDGNVYVAGHVYEGGTFGALSVPASDYFDAFILKYDSAGNEVWIRTISDIGSERFYDVAIDNDGNVYGLGFFQTAYNFYGTAISSDGSGDALVAKFTPSGDLVYAVSGGGPNSDSPTSIAVDSSQNTYISGYFSGTSFVFGDINESFPDTDYKAYVLKLNSSGVEQWIRLSDDVGGSSGDNYGMTVATDSSGNVYFGGSVLGEVNFGGTTIGASGVDYGFAIKFDTNGVEQWVSEVETTNYATTHRLTIGQDGYLYEVGGYYDDVTIQGVTLEHSPGAANGLYISKYTLDGELLMLDGGESTDYVWSYDLDALTDGTVLVSGEFYLDVTFDGVTASGPGMYSLFLAELAPVLPTVEIGGAACSDLSIVSSTELTCLIPAHDAGVVDVVVTNGLGESATLVGGFEYTADAPTPTPTATPTPAAEPVTAGAAHPQQPTDGEATSSTPAFSWQAPAEPENVSKYILVIDGVQVFEFEAGKSVETDAYILVYESSTQSYLLQLKEALEHGEHTWWIISRSTTGKDTESEHWTFVVSGGSGSGDATGSGAESDTGGSLSSSASPPPAATTSGTLSDSDSTGSADASASGQTETTGLGGVLPDLSGVGSGIASAIGSVFGGLSGGLGEGVQAVTESVSSTVAELRENPAAVQTAETTPAVMVLAAPALTAVAAATQVGWSLFSFKNMIKILKSTKYLVGGSMVGLTYDHNTLAPVSFALLTLRNADGSVQQSRLTNVMGRYRGFNPPAGTYTLSATHNLFGFASDKSQQVLGKFVYDGQPMTYLDAKGDHQYLVPMEAKKEVGVMGAITGVLIGLLKLNHRYHLPVSIVMFVVTVFLTLIAPNPLNVVLTGISGFFMLRNLVRALQRPAVRGVIEDTAHQPVANSLVAAVDARTGELTSVTTTDAKGKFKVKSLKGVNKILPIKPGFSADQRPVLADLQHHTSENVQLKMVPSVV